MSIFKLYSLFLFFTIIFSLNISKKGTNELGLNITHYHIHINEKINDAINDTVNNTINDTINEYLSQIPENFSKWKEDERIFLNKYFSLKELPSNNLKLFSEIKEQLLQKFSKEFNKNLTQINTVFLTSKWYFGNSYIAMNNIVFYCEILGCKKIILNSNYHMFEWFLKNEIIYKNKNTKIIIKQAPESSINCTEKDVVCSFLGGFLYYPMVVKQKIIDVKVFRNELLRNLPKVETDPRDLYIHIRSGDIFTNPSVSHFYAQPPLCFYQKILNEFEFGKIYIISQNNANVVIDKLLNEYKNVIFKTNNLETDISYLMFGYNLVASVSSFFTSIIKFNENVKNMWEYDIYRLSEKFCHLHHDFFKFPIKYNIYTMKASQNYKKEMFGWTKSDRQIHLMLNENCFYNFELKKPNL